MLKKPSKSHLICYVLMRDGPLPRKEILRRVHLFEGKDPLKFNKNANNSYFNSHLNDYWSARDVNVARRIDGGITSVVYQGLVRESYRDRRGIHYVLTDRGKEFALEFVSWCCCLYETLLIAKNKCDEPHKKEVGDYIKNIESYTTDLCGGLTNFKWEVGS